MHCRMRRERLIRPTGSAFCRHDKTRSASHQATRTRLSPNPQPLYAKYRYTPASTGGELTPPAPPRRWQKLTASATTNGRATNNDLNDRLLYCCAITASTASHQPTKIPPSPAATI